MSNKPKMRSTNPHNHSRGWGVSNDDAMWDKHTHTDTERQTMFVFLNTFLNYKKERTDWRGERGGEEKEKKKREREA